MSRATIAAALVVALASAAGIAVWALANAPPVKPLLDTARSNAALQAAFAKAPADWAGRLTGDATMQVCTAANNRPAPAAAHAIQERERASLLYPADGKFLGDWQKGEAIAQSGYGMRFTDYPPRGPNGGNCYACHQLTKAEVSYGTIGPSLLEYGRNRKFTEAETKAAYEKIYNGHVAFPCSLMPRFGANGVLSIEQIKDLVALLMDPASPVNK